MTRTSIFTQPHWEYITGISWGTRHLRILYAKGQQGSTLVQTVTARANGQPSSSTVSAAAKENCRNHAGARNHNTCCKFYAARILFFFPAFLVIVSKSLPVTVRGVTNHRYWEVDSTWTQGERAEGGSVMCVGSETRQETWSPAAEWELRDV